MKQAISGMLRVHGMDAAKRALRQAREMDDAGKADTLLRNLARRLEKDWEGVTRMVKKLKLRKRHAVIPFGAIKSAHCGSAGTDGGLMEWAHNLAYITGTVDQGRPQAARGKARIEHVEQRRTPDDPLGGSYHYEYISDAAGQKYCIGTALEGTAPSGSSAACTNGLTATVRAGALKYTINL